MAVASISPDVPSTPAPKLLALALEACGDGVLVFDDGGALAYANAAARAFLARAGAAAGSRREELVQLLEGCSARVIPLRAGMAHCGEAVYLPGLAASDDTLADRERRAIVETLEATRWRLSETARRLGISRTTLWRRVRSYGLVRRGESAAWR
jgi:transcriptional regulator of acetoin/glycerol metabolism